MAITRRRERRAMMTWLGFGLELMRVRVRAGVGVGVRVVGEGRPGEG